MTNQKYAHQYLVKDVSRAGGYDLWLCFRALPAVTIAVIIMLLLSVSPARAEEEVDPTGIKAGQMLIYGAHGRYSAAPLLDSQVHFDISGMIARVRVEQTFSNSGDQWVEAVYAFPLPETAAVRAMEMRVGDRRIVGEIKEKSEAKVIYQEARQAGKKASLVEQQRPNLFTNRVANIGPGERVTVKLEYVQSVEFVRGEFALRFPMTITPRYIPGNRVEYASNDEPHATLELNPYLGWSLPTDQVPDANAITPLQYPTAGPGEMLVNAIEITAVLDAGMPLAAVTSPYHELAMSRHKSRYNIHLADGFSEMDRDFVLTWQAATGSVPEAAVFSEEVAGEYYGVMMVVPPVIEGLVDSLSREVTFIIDTSGSMGGVAIAQARKSLSAALLELRPVDSFNIIEFNSTYRVLHKTAVKASRHNVQRAIEFVRQLDAGGGTEMLPALQAAIAGDSAANAEESGRVQQVVFITDGAVGNEQQLYREITNTLGSKRLFTVGIGSAPNSWFMRKAAQFGRGTHVHIGNLEEVAEKISALFEQIASPVAVNVQISWPLGVESYPFRVPDLYRGEPILVAVKSLSGPLRGEVLITGELAGSSWSRRLAFNEDPQERRPVAGHPGVASLWARKNIAAQLDELVTGTPEEEVRQGVLEVALKHRLMSPYTSFVAVEQRASRPSGEGIARTPVANTQPRGQSPQPYAYPRTATTAPANLLIGSMALFIALMVVVMRREEVDHVPTPQA